MTAKSQTIKGYVKFTVINFDFIIFYMIIEITHKEEILLYFILLKKMKAIINKMKRKTFEAIYVKISIISFVVELSPCLFRIS